MPFPNEHSARLVEADEFDPDSFVRTDGSGDDTVQDVTIPDTIAVIWGKLEGASEEGDPLVAQALRFPIENWTEEEAETWLSDNDIDFIELEAAEEEEPEDDDEEEPADGDEEKASVYKPKGHFNFSEISRHGYRFADCDRRAFELRNADPNTFVEVEPEVGNDSSGPRRFHMLANSGGVMDNWYWGRTVLDLESLNIPRQDIPAMRDHWDEIGFTTKVEKTDKGVEADGLFLQRNKEADQVIDWADQGFPWQSSVYVPPEIVEIIEERQKTTVNGFEFKGPGVVFRGAKLKETTVCSMGADQNTDTTVEQAAGREQVRVQLRLKPKGEEDMDLAELKAKHPETYKAAFAEGKTATAPVVDPKTAKATGKKPDAKTAERNRSTEILSEAKSLGMFELGAKLVADGVSADTAKSLLAAARQSAVDTDAPPTAGGGNEPPAGKPDLDAMSFDDRTEHEFKNDADVRAEFDSLDIYRAFARADKRGLIRIKS